MTPAEIAKEWRRLREESRAHAIDATLAGRLVRETAADRAFVRLIAEHEQTILTALEGRDGE